MIAINGNPMETFLVDSTTAAIAKHSSQPSVQILTPGSSMTLSGRLELIAFKAAIEFALDGPIRPS